MEVYDLGKARAWFLEHAGGELLCVKGSKSLIVSSYPEAEEFFNAD